VAFFGRFFGRAGSEAAGIALGASAVPALLPAAQFIVNEAWKLHPDKPPDVYVVAAGVAQGQVDPGEARVWANEQGISDAAFAALVDAASVGPALGLAYSAWRRGELGPDDFETAAKRLGIESRWFAALKALKDELLDPVQLANAIHRGLIPDPGLLAVPPPSGTGNVPAYPVYGIDALAEAAGSGINRERLGALVGLTGLPMGPHEAAQAVFRHILTATDYARAVAEGNTRNEWGDAILEQSRQIPTARDFLENALRGYRTLPEALQGAALWGMTPEHATMIYQNQGRPMVVRQITQALARGGKFKPEPGEITDPYDAAIVEGNLKPAYYDLAKALRYTLPSPFVMRALTEAGTWSEAKTRERLLWAGWFPEDAAEAAAAWAGGAGATGKELTKTELLTEFEGGYITENELRDHLTALGYSGPELDLEVHLGDARRIRSWRDKAITALGKRYVASTMEATAADGYLVEIGVPDSATRASIIRIWDIEREFK
jgi:hypothetical protein